VKQSVQQRLFGIGKFRTPFQQCRVCIHILISLLLIVF
jgi:hypothetical protein